MKKILMISGAALVAASAMAVAPAKHAAVQGSKNANLQRVSMDAKFVGSKPLSTVEALKRSKLSIRNQAFADEATADEGTEEETPAALNARYYYPPINTFYSACTPDFYSFPEKVEGNGVTWGVAGNKGVIPFLNLSTGATAYEWTYNFMGPDDNEWIPMTAETQHLPVAIEGPYQMFSAPILTAFAGEEQKTFNSPFVEQYLCGPDLAAFGYYPSNIFKNWEEAGSEYDYFGVTTCPVNLSLGSNTYTAEFAVDRKPVDKYKDYYNENGCCMQYVNAINKYYGEKYDVSNIRMSAYIAMLPEQTQTYLLDQTWFLAYYTASADVTLNVTVYGITDEGVIDMTKPIGAGEVVLPAHLKASSEVAIVDLEAVDEEGFPTSNPLVIDGAACVFIEGFNDPSITYFNMLFNGGTEFDDPDPDNADVNDYFASNAAILVDFIAKEKGVEDAPELNGSKIWDTSIFVYGQEAPFYGATDMNINYNVLFPYVMNDEGGEDLIVTAPAEGGDVEYHFNAYFLISGLVEEGLMTVESDADWFTCEAVRGVVEVDGKEYATNQINVKAEALPAGVEGRQGIVKFRGYASDFDLVVNQGDVSGISNVAAANGPVEFFDLQGRKLNNAPANGIYIMRQGNKTSKCIAK
ncbi:MAG: hypothetical protein K2K82_01655 [Muribaculaceae bacterium]|nr:hypothetical protein [Muribaculaceae bacterium]